MKITRENKGPLEAVVTVLVEKNDYEKTVADKLREYRQKASLPGFRPGKVPASLIQKRFEKPILAEEVNSLLTNNLNEYFKSENINLLGDPLPDNERQLSINWESDTDFEFVFDIAVAPDISIDFAHITPFDYYKIEVDEKMIDKDVESVRKSYGQNIDVAEVNEKSSVRGDFVQLDENGDAVEGGIQPSGVLIAVDLIQDETIKKAIIGKKAGDMVRFNPVTAFNNRHEVGHMLNISHEAAEDLNSEFSFTITNIADFKEAELNEELYRKIYGDEHEINSEEEFRGRISNEIAQRLAYSSNRKFAVDARDNLIANTPLELPEEFLKRWLKEMNKEMTAEQIENDFSNFLKDLRWQLIKNAIIKAHDISVSKEETVDFARQIAISQFYQYGVYQIPDEHLENFTKKILEKEEDREGIVRRILDNKVIAVVRDNGLIVEKEVTSDEFNALEKTNPETDDQN